MNLIDENKNKRKRTSIRYLDKKVEYTKYNQENKRILEDIFKDDEKYNYVAYHGNDEVKVQLIFFIARIILKQNVDVGSNILEILKIDDLIVYDGKRGRYKGLEDLYDEEKIKIEFDNGDAHYIRSSNHFKLSRYFGS